MKTRLDKAADDMVSEGCPNTDDGFVGPRKPASVGEEQGRQDAAAGKPPRYKAWYVHGEQSELKNAYVHAYVKEFRKVNEDKMAGDKAKAIIDYGKSVLNDWRGDQAVEDAKSDDPVLALSALLMATWHTKPTNPQEREDLIYDVLVASFNLGAASTGS